MAKKELPVANTYLYKDGEKKIVDANDKEAFKAATDDGWEDTPQAVEEVEDTPEKSDEELQAENDALVAEQEAHDKEVADAAVAEAQKGFDDEKSELENKVKEVSEAATALEDRAKKAEAEAETANKRADDAEAEVKNLTSQIKKLEKASK